MDVLRDFEDRTECFDEVVRIAVNPDQIASMGLSEAPAKPGTPGPAGLV